MLVEFSVTNYRSFRDRATLSMVAGKPVDDEAGRVFLADERPAKPLRLLRTAAVYGANAAGKSNLIKALAYMERMVAGPEGAQANALRRTPFRLDPGHADKPSEFEVTILQDGERYTYGFAVDEAGIAEEWLFAGLPRPRMLFQRERAEVSFGPSWRGDRQDLVRRTAGDSLFLRVAAEWNHPVAASVKAWFSKRLYVLSGLGWAETYTLGQIHNSEDFRASLRRFLDAADLAISEIDVEVRPLAQALADTSLPHEAQMVLDALGTSFPADALSMRAKVLRQDSEGALHAFDLDDEESAGTRRMVGLAGPWLDGLRDGDVLVVDEFDTRLHPRLARFLVDTWQSTNSRAQLILTTHNTELLEGDVLRRDQVWIAEKDRAQRSMLYSLAEFKPLDGARAARTTENYRRGYLAGRYGGVPIVGGITHGEAT